MSARSEPLNWKTTWAASTSAHMEALGFQPTFGFP
jgi:hypothetical protein